MFQENFDIVRYMCCSFANTLKAKLKGVSELKWILVNIQDTTEFASQRLNRDTWSNPELKSIIKESFIFWQVRLDAQLQDSNPFQRYFDSAEGGRYCTFYPAASVKPHIAIIDPRTGELMKHWTGFVDAPTLVVERR
jgi:hypothetical protein